MIAEFAISIAGVAITILAAWWLMRGLPKPPLTPARAMQIAEDALTGFVAESAIVDGASGAALVRSGDGFAVLKPMGDDWSVRKVEARAVRTEGDVITVDTGEPMFGTVRLRSGARAEVRGAELAGA